MSRFISVGVYFGIVWFVTVILMLLIQSILIYAVYQVLLGERVSLGESIACALKRLVTLCFISLLVGFCMILVWVAFGVLAALFGRLMGFFGVFLAVVPCVLLFLILTCKWVVAIPACIVEDLGGIASMGRSSSLTEGYRLKIFGLMLITGFFGWLFRFLGNLIFPFLGFIGNFIGQILMMSIPLAFGCAMYAVVYYDLLAVKEGISIDRLAEVFD